MLVFFLLILFQQKTWQTFCKAVKSVLNLCQKTKFEFFQIQKSIKKEKGRRVEMNRSVLDMSLTWSRFMESRFRC